MLHLPGNLMLAFSGMKLVMGQVRLESGLPQIVRQTFRDGGNDTIATSSGLSGDTTIMFPEEKEILLAHNEGQADGPGSGLRYST
jgi:hypothetical protein